jgi:hypothetical protein
MSESLDQTQDRIADELLPESDEQVVETRRSYPGTLPSDTYTNDPAEKWARGHEKRRLRAYLKGNMYFAHGRVPAMPFGFRPKMWPVTPQIEQE